MHDGKGEKIRLYEAHTPESHQDFGRKAKTFTSDMVFGKTVEYVYDPLGRRIVKKVDGAIKEKYLWEWMTRVLSVSPSLPVSGKRRFSSGSKPTTVPRAAECAPGF